MYSCCGTTFSVKAPCCTSAERRIKDENNVGLSPDSDRATEWDPVQNYTGVCLSVQSSAGMYQTLRVFTKLTTSEQPALSNRLVRPVLRPIPSSGRNEWLDRFILATHLCIHVSIYPFLYQRDNPQTHGSVSPYRLYGRCSVLMKNAERRRKWAEEPSLPARVCSIPNAYIVRLRRRRSARRLGPAPSWPHFLVVRGIQQSAVRNILPFISQLSTRNHHRFRPDLAFFCSNFGPTFSILTSSHYIYKVQVWGCCGHEH
jgi:hypothetical protein